MVTTIITIGLGLVCLHLSNLIRRSWTKNASDSQKSLYTEFRETLKRLAALIRDVSTLLVFFGALPAYLFAKVATLSLSAVVKFIAAMITAMVLLLLQLL